MSINKPIVSMTEISQMVQLSRARFYQLLEQGFFPKPLHDERSKRPYYDLALQQKCLECRQSGIGVDGSYMLFYSPRKKENVSDMKRKKIDPIVKEITELHNGKISIKSKLGKGSQVKVSLPLKFNEKIDL